MTDVLDRFLLDLGGLFRARTLYPQGNPRVVLAAEKAARSLSEWGRPVRIALLGDGAVVEDRSFPAPPPRLQPLLRALRKSRCESARIESAAGAGELASWAEHIVSAAPGSYRGPGVASGSMNLEPQPAERPQDTTRLAQAAAGYLSLLPKTEEALTDLAAQRPGGLLRAREIVRAIAGHLAAGEDLIRPICELKDHDDYTLTHALNVSVLSSALGRALGASREMLEILGLAALCHDVGKKKIPGEILNKPGKLEPEERRIMDGHAAAGAQLLLAMSGSLVHPLLPVVAYQHHRGTNGSGYPRSEVPGPPHAMSLIVAVADVFDALRTVRPYRAAWSTARACTILIEKASTGELHRACVAAFLGHLAILAPGRRVALSDGRGAVVIRAGRPDPLRPVVRSEDDEVLDLMSPAAPRLAEVRESDR